jgi:lysozyme family protein
MSFIDPDFRELYQTAHVKPELRSALATVVTKAVQNRAQYEQISSGTTVPWWMVAAIHQKECGMRFDCHLHNGDPLSARTVRVPPGRPLQPDPPYTFVQSAIDALHGEQKKFPQTWDVVGALSFAEHYNGTGYRRQNVYSPYVWGGTQHYTTGHYIADGKFDPMAIAKAPGVAAILLMMEERGLVQLDHSAADQHEGSPPSAS